MPRLRSVSAQDLVWRRVRHGRGFRYLDRDGTPLDADHTARIRELVIPPAWRDVALCPHPTGHLQAVGTDDAGRRQYLYHPEWRRRRDEQKFVRVLQLASGLPRARQRIRDDLDGDPAAATTVLAAAVRMVDLGCFRLGSDSYAEENGSYGLTTLERRHVRLTQAGCEFSFVGKSGVEHDITLADPAVCRVLHRVAARQPPETRILRAREGRAWRTLTAADVNAYLKSVFGREFTAKDFRTWHATVHVAEHLARAEPATTVREETRRVRAAVVSASELLGNTPTVCRSSYVDPRVIDLYTEGVTIAGTLRRLPKDADRAQDRLDRAVVRLLRS